MLFALPSALHFSNMLELSVLLLLLGEGRRGSEGLVWDVVVIDVDSHIECG